MPQVPVYFIIVKHFTKLKSWAFMDIGNNIHQI
jgi:hypothetical protein